MWASWARSGGLMAQAGWDSSTRPGWLLGLMSDGLMGLMSDGLSEHFMDQAGWSSRPG